MVSEPYQQLVTISKARIFDLMRQGLRVNLTPDAKSVAFHNDLQGRIRERFDILDSLLGVQRKKAGFIAKVKSLVHTRKSRDEQ